jgi:hypothetical protein
MAFCPNCEAEYKPGFTVCPDCKINLVSELTPENKVHDTEKSDMIAFKSFGTPTEADMAQELLERNGVRSFVKGGSFSAWPTTGSQDIMLMVDERDMPEAIRIFETYFPSDSAPETESETEPETETESS